MSPSPDDAPTWFQLQVSRPQPQAAVLRITGELDASAAAEVTGCLQQLRGPETTELIIDLSEVTFMGSAGVSVLLAAHHRSGRPTDASDRAPAVHLIGVVHNPSVRHVLHLLGLDTLFSSFPDLQACLRHLAETDSRT